MPIRLRERLSIYIYNNMLKNQIPFLDLVADKREFIIWITPKLSEVHIIQGSYMQSENENLTHINFILKGQAEFMHRRKIPYYTLTTGSHFGVEDIYFRMNQTQVEFIEERKENQALK